MRIRQQICMEGSIVHTLRDGTDKKYTSSRRNIIMSKILITDAIGESGIEFLKKLRYEIDYRPAITHGELSEAIVDADALIVRGRTKVTGDIISLASKLKAIARSGTGVDTIDIETAKAHKITVVNAPGANAEAVAEHTFGLLLALTRRIPETAGQMKTGGWPKNSYHGTELTGKTMGIVGYGHVGVRVGEIAHAFGMKILAYNRTTDNSDKVNHLKSVSGKFVTLDELLRDSDVISLHVALTDETRGLFDTEAFKKMKKNVYLINVSRGAVIDEEALASALQEQTIAGAGLDVFQTEPLADDSPLRKFTNVVLTPHVASVSPESENRASLSVAMDVDAILHGKRPKHEVL